MRLPAVLVTPLHIRFNPPVRLSRSTPSVSLTERHLHLSSAGKTVSYNFSVLLQFYLLTICHHGGFNQRSWDIQGQHLFIFYENLFYRFIYRKWAYFVLTLQQSATLDQFQSHSTLHKIFSNEYTIWFSLRDTITNISREVKHYFVEQSFILHAFLNKSAKKSWICHCACHFLFFPDRMICHNMKELRRLQNPPVSPVLVMTTYFATRAALNPHLHPFLTDLTKRYQEFFNTVLKINSGHCKNGNNLLKLITSTFLFFQVEKVACSTQTPDSVLQRFSASQRLQSPGASSQKSSSGSHQRVQSPGSAGHTHKRSHNRGHLLAASSINNPTPANTPRIRHKDRNRGMFCQHKLWTI